MKGWLKMSEKKAEHCCSALTKVLLNQLSALLRFIVS